MQLCGWPWAKLALSPLSGPLSHQKKGLQTRRGGSHSEKTRLVPLIWSGDSQGLLPCCSPRPVSAPGGEVHTCSHVLTRIHTHRHAHTLRASPVDTRESNRPSSELAAEVGQQMSQGEPQGPLRQSGQQAASCLAHGAGAKTQGAQPGAGGCLPGE